MLHLQAGVHLDEIGSAVAGYEEFHRGQGMVAHCAHKAARVVLELFAQIPCDTLPGRGGHFHEFLVVSLDSAVALVKGKDIAVVVGQNLDLDVVHVGQELFHKEVGVAEGGLGHGGGLEEGVLQLLLVVHGKDAAATAAAFCLEHDGKANLLDDLPCGRHVHSAVGTGHNRNAEAFCDCPCLHLVAKEVHGLLARADEDNACLAAQGREAAVFRGKAPAGVNADNPFLLGKGHDGVDIQVGAGIGTEQNELLGCGCRRRCLVHIGGGHGCNGIEVLTD